MDSIINLLISYGIYGIILAALAEAIFLPVPMELVSIPVYLLNPSKAFIYSIALIAFSFLGSIAGYFVGKLFGKPLKEKFSTSENFNKLKKLYTQNSFLAVLTSVFSPIPYEAYVLSAGIFDIGLPGFLMASFLSRVIRHLPQGILIFLYGERLLENIESYATLLGLVVFSVIFLGKYMSRLSRKK